MSSPTPKVWSLEEANSALPDLSFRIGRQMVLLAQIEDCFLILRERLGDVDEHALEPMPGDPIDVEATKEHLRMLLERFRSGWRDIEAIGVLVKDPRIGLIDFYGTVDGEIVFLCWQYGETSVGFYHSLDGGFAARQPLDAGTQRRMLN